MKNINTKYSYEYIYDYFYNNNCELLSETYEGSNNILDYICCCGTKSKISFSSFKRGTRCQRCKAKKLRELNRVDFSKVLEKFKEFGYLVHTKENEYINGNSKLDIICKQGHKNKKSFHDFMANSGCQECSGRKKLTYDYIKNYIESFDFKLISSEYINSSSKLEVRCSNNHMYKVTWDDFKQGYRCKQCYLNNNKDENHPRWNSNRKYIKLNRELRIKKSRNWIIKNMKDDPNYNSFLLNPKNFHLDHIIPINIFTELFIYYKNLNRTDFKTIINFKDNLQILTKEENLKKYSKGSIFKATQYLMLNGVKLYK